MSLGIGLIVGLVLGLTGAGGSIFAVPLLMAGLGYSITQAATVSLLAVAISAAVGTTMAWKHSYVRYRAASLMAAVGVLFAPLGIRVADRMPPTMLALVFALVLAVVAARMFYTAMVSKEDAAVVRSAVAGEGRSSVGRIGSVNPETGRLIWTRPVAFTVSIIGAATGFLSGLLGVGGGFVIVPAIRATLPLSMHSAVATSLMAIALTSTFTFISGILQGRAAPLSTALPFVAGAVLGMILGRRVAPLISGPALQQGFAATVGIIAFVMARGGVLKDPPLRAAFPACADHPRQAVEAPTVHLTASKVGPDVTLEAAHHGGYVRETRVLQRSARLHRAVPCPADQHHGAVVPAVGRLGKAQSSVAAVKPSTTVAARPSACVATCAM